MKICMYRRQTPMGRIERLGIMQESLIIDPNLVMESWYEKQGYYQPSLRALRHCPTSLSDFLIGSDHPIESLKTILIIYEKLAREGILKTKNGGGIAFDLKDDSQVTLGVPLDKIASYRDFFSHEKHVKKGFEKRNEPIPPAWYEIPAYYKGATTGFIATEDMIPWPSYTKELDYELELGLVIGRDGKNIKAKDVNQYIFGYTILNDISARDIQRKEMSIRLGPAKGKDFCSIMGPVIVTADEFDSDPNLLMTASVNGVEWSRGLSGDAHYSWGEMIEHFTKDEWMRATDFLGSGTVGTGCGLELSKLLNPGDQVELYIEKIGTLKNIVGTPELN